MTVTSFPPFPTENELVYRSDLGKYFIFRNFLWVEYQFDPNITGTYSPSTDYTGSDPFINNLPSEFIKLTNNQLHTIETIIAGTEGQIVTLENLTGNTLSVLNESGSPLTNRILTGSNSNITLAQNISLTFEYSTGLSRWKALGSTPIYGQVGVANTLAKADGTSGAKIKGTNIVVDALNNMSSSGTFYSGSSSIDPSASLQLDSTSKGVLPPRMTSTQRNAIAAPAIGLVIFNTDSGVLNTYNGTNWRSAEGNPVGTVLDFAGTDAPTGYLLCYGQSVSRTTYSDLFGILGTTFGSANISTFKLPDLRGRVVAGLDNMGGSSASRLTSSEIIMDSTTLGASGGYNEQFATTEHVPQHNHSGFTGQHTHDMYVGYLSAAPGSTPFVTTAYPSAPTIATNPSNVSIQNDFTGTRPISATQPTMVMQKIIKF